MYIEIILLLQSHHILLMAGRGRGRVRGNKKSPKKPAKKSSFRKKAPPNPTPPHLRSDYASSHHDEKLDISPSPTPVRSPSASQTSRPYSPVSPTAGDGKGPGEGPV